MHSLKQCCDGLDNSNKEESVREYNTYIPTLFLMTFFLVLWEILSLGPSILPFHCRSHILDLQAWLIWYFFRGK